MEPETPTLKERVLAARMRLGLLMSTGLLVLVSSASATTINWTAITELLDGVVNLFPSILTLVTNIFPIIIVLSIIGFVVAFLDKILGMIKI